MKLSKKLLSLLLCMLMLAGVMPVGAFAENEPTDARTESDSAIGGASGMGLILNNLEQTNTDENDSGCSVSNCTIKGKEAFVRFGASKDCILVVAIYDENTNQMLGSGIKNIGSEDKEATLSIDIATMPEYYLVKVFMLNEDYSPLSSSFSFFEHTSVYEEFMSVTPDDFDDERIVEFGEDVEESFGALSEDVVIPDTDKSMTVDYNPETGVYTFINPVEEIKNLKVGDSLYYEIDYDDIIILKVAKIEISGNAVYITEDIEIALDDVFDYIRYDEGFDTDDYNPADVDCGEYSEMTDFEVIDSEEYNFEEGLKTQSEDAGDEGSDIKGQIISTNFKINFIDKKSEHEVFQAKVTGSIGITIGASARLHWDIKIGPDYFEYKVSVETKTELNLSVTGSVSVPADEICWQIDGKDKDGNPKGFKLGNTGLFRLYIKIYPVISLEAKIDLIKITILNEKGVILNSTDGYNKISNESKWIDGDFLDLTITLKIGVGIEFEVGRKAGKKDEHGDQKLMATVKVTVEVYWKGTLSPENIGSKEEHTCQFCLSGTSDFCVDGSIKVELKIYKVLNSIKKKNVKLGKLIDENGKLVITALSLSYEKDLGKCYACFDKNGNFQFGFGECPNKKISLTVKAVDEKNKSVENVSVDCAGACYITDKNGQVIIYLKSGNYTVTASFDGTVLTQYVNLSESGKELTFKFDGTVPDTPTDPTNPGYSDGTGSNDGWADSTHIRFGSYPQTDVTASMGAVLDSMASSWKSYEYYSGTGEMYDGIMKASDYMMYCDVKYGENKYRGVKFTSYRPPYTGKLNAYPYYQLTNGYDTDTTYWFRYEPLVWRVLGSEDGGTIVMSENIIDSQAFNNYILLADGEYWGNSAKTSYANNYSKSSIRSWLINDFYSTAFSSTQQNRIVTRECDNSCYVPAPEYYKYYGNPLKTNDKVFLLSFDEAMNANFSFESDARLSDTAKIAQGTDYSRCQGLCVDSRAIDVNDGNSWWLRSSTNVTWSGCFIDGDGNRSCYSNVVNTTYIGVRPAIKLDLSLLTTQSASEARAAKEGTVFNYTCSACEAGGEYILLNVTGYGSDFELTTSNLEYIDQLTADASGKVEGTFMPRNAYSNSTTMLIGKFGNTVQAKKLDVTEGTAEEIAEKFEIKGYVENLPVDYKATLTFTTTVEAPAGYKIVWSNGVEGKECTLTKVTNSEYQISAKLIKISDGTTLKETKVETVTVKTNFFAKLIAFFKGLFGSLPKYVDNKRV